ncbi:MAG: glycosyltransferase [Bacteroidetes bacterium]|nr:glycosyltransferase [Bacteroidota bacterium]
MRICIVGSEKVWSIDKLYYKYLVEEGIDVAMFPAHDLFHDYYYKSFVNKILYRTGISGILNGINSSFLQFVEEFKPDVVWVFKGMEISPKTLSFLHEREVFLVNYNPDNPFLFTGRGSGNRNITASIPYYDLFFTYDALIAERLKKEFGKSVEILPFGYELEEADFESAKEKDEAIKLCFLGNPDKYRAAFILQLAEKIKSSGGQVVVVGNHWNTFIPDNSEIQVHPPVYGSAFWSTLRRYRVQLNIMRPHNLYSHNMRSFEIPAVGGIMLTPQTDDHARYFENGESAFFYKDLNEAAEKALYLLNMPVDDANLVRTKARGVSLANGYSYKERALQALLNIESYKMTKKRAESI